MFVDSPGSCELYHNESSDAVCYRFGSIGRDYVFVNNSAGNSIDSSNVNMVNFLDTLRMKDESGDFPPDCVDLIFELMCYNTFPLCDYGSDTPRPRQVSNTVKILITIYEICLLCCRSAGLIVRRYTLASVMNFGSKYLCCLVYKPLHYRTVQACRHRKVGIPQSALFIMTI